MQSKKKIAVIGGGWAGCAAAATLASRGHRVTLIESARTLGGRARRVLHQISDQTPPQALMLDNGQHILLGAYHATRMLLRHLGVDETQCWRRLPFQMHYPISNNGCDFLAGKDFSPWHLIGGLWSAKGFDRSEKWAIAIFLVRIKIRKWHLANDCTVTQLFQQFAQPARVIELFWRPLCLAALNTPCDQASAQIFLNILRDSVGAKQSASNILIPTVDLTSLLPQAVAHYLLQQQDRCKIEMGRRVTAIDYRDGSYFLTYAAPNYPTRPKHRVPGIDVFDAIVIATSPTVAANLIAYLPNTEQSTLAIRAIRQFTYNSITTCYLQYDACVSLQKICHGKGAGFYPLKDDPKLNHWGQFVFDRGHFHIGQEGLLAVVISAANEIDSSGNISSNIGDNSGEIGMNSTIDSAPLGRQIAQQLAQAFDAPLLQSPHWIKIFTEKRATFACTPNLSQPGPALGLKNCVLAGDYVVSSNRYQRYPATLETAVRSGIEAAKLLD